MESLDFLNRQWLFALFALPLFYLVLKRFSLLRQRRIVALGGVTETGKFLVLLPLLFLACAILAISRPYLGYEDVKVPRSGRDLMLAVDVSLSMAARDHSPTRMDFVKRKIRDIIDYISRTAPGDRLGIVLFAGESYLYCPLTSDYAVLKTFTNSISVGLVSSGGSAITQALVTAANSFANTKSLKPAVLLISDGEDNEIVTQRSLDVLKGLKLNLWAIGVGSLEGKPIELRDGILLKDAAGHIVVSKLNETNLRQLAEGSGGLYQRATIDDSDLLAIFSDIGKKVASGGTAKDLANVRIYHEFGPFFLWLPLVLIPFFVFAGRREIIFSFLLVAWAAPSWVGAQEAKVSPATETLSLHDAQAAYADGNFEAAKESFSLHLKDHPSDRRALHALAATEYRLGNLKEAESLFSQLADQAQSGRERFQALYDKGTVNIAAKEYAEAVDALENALKIKPGDEAAQHNLDVALKLKQQQEKEQKEKPNEKDQKQQKQDQKQDKDQSSPQQEEKKEEEQKKQEEEQKESEQKDKQKQEQNKDQDEQGKEPQQQKEEGEKEKQDPDEGKDGEPQGSKETPAPGATPDSNEESPTPSSDSSGQQEMAEKEQSTANPTPSNEDQNTSGQPSAKHDPKALKEQEARAWLESLDDSPVLLRRQVGNKRSTQQQSW